MGIYNMNAHSPRQRVHQDKQTLDPAELSSHGDSNSPKTRGLSHQHQGSNYPQHHQGYNYSGDEEGFSSRNEIRQKSKELHEILKKKREKQSLPMESGASVSRSLISKDANSNSNVHTNPSSRGSDLNYVSSKEGRIKHIVLNPNHRLLSGNESSGVEICKKLFGITVFEYSNGKAKWNHVTKDRKLVVQGVVEGSVSHSSGRIYRGDMLVGINDVDVSWLNFTRLLTSLNKRNKVKLTFQSPRIVGPKTSYSVLQVPEADLCLAVLGKRLSHIHSELSQHACVAMYLTLVPSSSESEINEKEDIIYAFPPGEEKLTALRGLFITLSSALVDVVDQPASSSCLGLTDCNVTVAYKQSGRDVFVLALPDSRISSSSVTDVLEAFISLMVLLFADVKRAFSDCDKTWLDKVLALMFHQALGLHTFLPTHPTLSPSLFHNGLTMTVSNYHAVKVLTLSHENMLICDEILSELESMDFDDYMEPDDFFSRRQYTVHGASLFYKDHLICSHILAEQQRDVNLFLNCHGLLALSSRQHVDQVMVWQEMKSYAGRDTNQMPAGYRPCQTHSFLLIIGMQHYYLAAIIEAGGCSQPVRGQARPHPLLVEQGKVTLKQLETDEVHMSTCCEERLTSPNESVSLASPDQLCTVMTPRSRNSARDASMSRRLSVAGKQPLTPTKATPEKLYISRSKSVDRLEERENVFHTDVNSVVMRRQGSKMSYGSNDSAGSGSSTGPPKSRGSRVSSTTDLSSIARSMSVLQIDIPHDVVRGGRLGQSKENTLFNYVHLCPGEGILIAPTEAELSEIHSSLQQQVLENFSMACLKMKGFFTQQVTGCHDNQSLFGNSVASEEKVCREIGSLFHCTVQPGNDKKQQVTTLQYWVVGRSWSSPRPQEMYVCFHESTNQSLVELAFALGFGT